MIDFDQLERFIDTTTLGTGAREEVPELEQWAQDHPLYAARYLALLRSWLIDD